MSEMKTTVVIDGRDLLSPLMQNILANSSRLRMELTRSTGMDTGMAGLLTGKGVSTSVADGIRRVSTELTGVFSAYQALSTAKGFLEKGVEFNAMWEQSRLGIGSIITAVDTLTDAQGKTLTGMEKYSAAQALAEQSMKRIQVSALETTATTDEMVRAFQVLIGPTAAVGGNLEQTADLAYSIVQAMGALNIPMRELSSESRALLEGSIQQTQDRLAVSLGITNDMVRNWKSQGTLIQEILKRLEPFKLAGKDVADTWGGLTSNLKDAVSFLSGQTGRGIFTGFKDSYRLLLSEIIDTKNLTAGKDISNITDAVTRLNSAIGGGVVSATESFIDLLHRLNDPEALVKLETTLNNVAHAGSSALTVLGGVGTAAGGLLGTVVDGWNTLPEPIRDAGLIGALIGGKKGFGVVAGFSVLSGIGDRWDRAMAEINKGTMSWGDLIFGGKESVEKKLAEIADPANYQDTLNKMQANQRTYVRGSAGWQAMQANIDRAMAEEASRQTRAADAASLRQAASAGRQPSITDGIKVSSSPRDATAATDAQKRKITEAMQAITKELAQMTDTGTEGEGRIAALTKKYEDFAETLGKGAPKVKEFNAVIDYAREHNGYTPQQVAQFERGVQKEISALEDRAKAVAEATRSDGTIDQQRLGMLTATAAAEREYRDDLLRGIDETVAAKKRDLAVSDAAAQKRQQDLAAYEAFYQQLASLYTNDEALQRSLLEKRVRAFRENNISELDIARWRYREELNIATDAWSGMQRGFIDVVEANSNAARNFQQATTDVFGAIKGVVNVTADGIEMRWENMLTNMANALANVPSSALVGFLGSTVQGWFKGTPTGGSPSTIAYSGVASARGNAFASDALSRFSGQVVEKPTLFTFARGGIGLMGEGTRKEGIFPLSRDSQGNLGLSAKGMGNVVVEFNVIESAKSSAEVTQTPTANGVRFDVAIVDVVAQDIAKGGRTVQALNGRGYVPTARTAGRG